MRMLRGALPLTVGILIAVLSISLGRLSAGPAQTNDDAQALKSFAAIHPIDTHVHVFKTDPAFQAMLERLQVKLLNILVMDDTLSYRK